MLHWEDFGAGNARRILNKYADQVCTFNDDMQGTAAVVLAAAFAAVRRRRQPDARPAGRHPRRRHRRAGHRRHDARRHDPRRPDPDEATRRFYAVDRRGLLDRRPRRDLHDFQLPYARPAAEVAGLDRAGRRRPIGLAEVVAHVQPTMLIGTSTQTGAFTEPIVREMAAHAERPIIMPLSNPTSKARPCPADLIALDRRPGAGRHRQPVPAGRPRRAHLPDRPGQQRPRLPRPRPRRHRRPGQPDHRPHDRRRRRRRRRTVRRHHARRRRCCPPVDDLRAVSAAVAIAVAAAAAEEGLAQAAVDNPIQQVHEAMWRPDTHESTSNPLITVLRARQQNRAQPGGLVMPGSVIVGGARTPIGKLVRRAQGLHRHGPGRHRHRRGAGQGRDHR